MPQRQIHSAGRATNSIHAGVRIDRAETKVVMALGIIASSPPAIRPASCPFQQCGLIMTPLTRGANGHHNISIFASAAVTASIILMRSSDMIPCNVIEVETCNNLPSR